MAEPFSIVAGAAGLADVCIKVAKVLKQAKDSYQGGDEELSELYSEVIRLRDINDLVQRIYEAESTLSPDPTHQQILVNWQVIESALVDCERVVGQINTLLASIIGVAKGKHVKLDHIRVSLKQQAKEEDLRRLRVRLSNYHLQIQSCLAAANIAAHRNAQNKNAASFSEIGRAITNLGIGFDEKIERLRTPSPSQDHRLTLNKHFYPPQTVSSFFTGRQTELQLLKQYLNVDTTDAPLTQKRFVIFGLSGSGKTQFCCKFASDCKQSFWGVFWIDATSREHAKQSFSTISAIAMVDSNPMAAKNWLSSLGPEQPWLLIIDNADEQDVNVENYYPDGSNGTILITTINPILKVQGTVGPKYFEFRQMDEVESVKLLLTIADQPKPWSEAKMSSAREICEQMGHLPLSLVHAGRAILAQLCTTEDYLIYLENSWDKLRRHGTISKDTSTFNPSSSIYPSYELLHGILLARDAQASKDALDILRIFSFLHGQNIPLSIFSRAAVNPKFQQMEQLKAEAHEKTFSRESAPPVTWRDTLKKFGFGVYEILMNWGTYSPLPRFMQEMEQMDAPDESNLLQCLRAALGELFAMSLISSSSGSRESCSIHPAVHLWIRKRPDMTLMEQAVWCQVTANILVRAILVPPLGDKEAEEETFRRDILPHVRHIQRMQDELRGKFLRNQLGRRRLWPVLKPRFDRAWAMECIKFSLVLAQGGYLQEAEGLQSSVAEFAIQKLGYEHARTMDIMLLLSITYWQLMKGEAASELQKRVLEACINARGLDDLKTLKFMDIYGESRWQQGRIPEAKKIHETVVKGLSAKLGPDHIETLKAKGNLGRAIGKDFQFSEAIMIQTEVLMGLKGKLDPTHSMTIWAVDNLAMAYYDRAAFGHGEPGDLDQALALEQEAFAVRTERLGRESLYTLWSGLNLARIRATRGETDEALAIFLPGHEIARRNLGESHFGYMLGKIHHGRILMCAGRFEEAEQILAEVVQQYEGDNRKGHPDHLLSLFSYIKCRNVLDRPSGETESLIANLRQGTTALYGADHVAMEYLLDPSHFPTGFSHDRTDSSHGHTGSTRQEMIDRYGHI